MRSDKKILFRIAVLTEALKILYLLNLESVYSDQCSAIISKLRSETKLLAENARRELAWAQESCKMSVNVKA